MNVKSQAKKRDCTSVYSGCELFGPQLAKDQITTSGLTLEKGSLVLPDGPGLGVQIDEGKLAKYARAGAVPQTMA